MIPSIDSGIEAAAIILALSLLYLQGFRQTSKVSKVEKTLTETNGGGHVKDQLNRIEKHQQETDHAIKVHGKLMDDHIEWSDEFVKGIDDRLSRIERYVISDKRGWFK